MPPLSYVGCLVTGHQTFTPTVTISGASTVLTLSMPVHRATDQSVPHPGIIAPPHPVVTALGSTTVLVLAMPAARIGDMTACTSFLGMGNPTVIVGG